MSLITSLLISRKEKTWDFSDFFLHFHQRSYSIQYLPRIGVHPVLGIPDVPVPVVPETTTFWKESAQNPVLVLIGASFRSTVRMGEVESCPAAPGKDRSLKTLAVSKLGSVVKGD